MVNASAQEPEPPHPISSAVISRLAPSACRLMQLFREVQPVAACRIALRQLELGRFCSSCFCRIADAQEASPKKQKSRTDQMSKTLLAAVAAFAGMAFVATAEARPYDPTQSQGWQQTEGADPRAAARANRPANIATPVRRTCSPQPLRRWPASRSLVRLVDAHSKGRRPNTTSLGTGVTTARPRSPQVGAVVVWRPPRRHDRRPRLERPVDRKVGQRRRRGPHARPLGVWRRLPHLTSARV